MSNRFGEWRHLEAHVTDLRDDRHVRGVVLNARDITERVRLEERADPPGVPRRPDRLANRALFRDRLDQALARSERSRELLAVLLVDLDGFKQVNDSLGHDAGDQLLQQVAPSASTRSHRPSDTLARLGGDEFAMLLDGARRGAGDRDRRRLLERLAEPVRDRRPRADVGASIGDRDAPRRARRAARS